MIDNGVMDHHVVIRLHKAGIKLKGATHDAIGCQSTVLVSHLEGPVSYPTSASTSSVHTGAYAACDGRDHRPDAAPGINLPVDASPRFATRIGGASAGRRAVRVRLQLSSRNRRASLKCPQPMKGNGGRFADSGDG